MGRGVKIAEIKDKDATPSKLKKKEIGGWLAKIGIYKVGPPLKKLLKICKKFKKVKSSVLI